MILIDFFIGFFAIFISPQIFLYYKYDNFKYSLILLYGLILSFSVSWLIFLITFYLGASNRFVYLLALFITISSLIYMYKNQSTKGYDGYIIWGASLLLIFPLLLHIGDGFTAWDGVLSWNRWARELYNNEFHPLKAAYPILLPSMWSLIYKIQGTSDIWWTSQISLFTIPLFISAALLALYYEYKNKAFLFMLISLYPYLIWELVVDGNMDVVIMLIGTLSLITLYAAEINKNEKEFEYYIYAALLLAGIASIIKQAGLAFVLFNIVYVFLHLNQFNNKKRLFIFIFLSFAYFLSFLLLFYQYQSDATGNLGYLQKYAHEKAFSGKSVQETIKYLWDIFFSSPPNIIWINSIIKPLNLPPITPFLILTGLLLFLIKNLRKYKSVAFLSTIFFFIGVFTWSFYFSYAARNSFWVKSFFIIFFSVNISYIFTKYFKKSQLKYFLFSLVILIIGYFYLLGNNFAYKKQKSYQEKIDHPSDAKTMVRLLEKKDVCVKIYTNNRMFHYNYFLRNIENRIIYVGWDGSGALRHLKHTCKDGRYFIFRSKTATEKNAGTNTGWKKIKVLEKNGKITPIDKQNNLIYFVPPIEKKGK